MTSALLILGGAFQPPSIADDLGAAGVCVTIVSSGSNIVQTALSGAPDLVIFYQEWADDSVFAAATQIGQIVPRPVIVFTRDPDAENIAKAMSSGVHAYIIDGYSPTRLRSVIHLAQARFRRDRLMSDELAQLNRRFEERTLVDRAKGILMGARQLREEEAYRVLRRVAMHTKQRIGQVSQHVIDSARYAEAVNRAGQLRMLSQRLVKLFALSCTQTPPGDTAALLSESIALVEETLAILSRSVSQPTFGDLIDAVSQPWGTLKPILSGRARTSLLSDVDRLAEQMLSRSEQLTGNLEVSGFASALHIINVAGRQRMLSQRLAKASLMAVLLEGSQARAAKNVAACTATELLEGMAYLIDLPLSSVEISSELAAASKIWDDYQVALNACGTASGVAKVAALSEALLLRFDRLTTLFERAMQVFVSAGSAVPERPATAVAAKQD